MTAFGIRHHPRNDQCRSICKGLILILRSLAKDCTPLKHRYDSCFNLWFEGYLQPALDHPDRLASFLSAPVAPPEPDSRGSGAHASPPAVVSTGTSLQHGRIITNWSKAFRPRAADVQADGSGQSSSMSPPDPKPVADAEPLDTRGKTRAQIKADEYERACGHLWRQYQGCLKVCSIAVTFHKEY